MSPRQDGGAAGAAPIAPAVVTTAVALAYAAVGLLALLLAGPPGYASPLYPSAGLALAAVLTFGRPALLGVALGAFAVNVSLGVARGLDPLSASMLVLPVLIGTGAALQAGAGAWLVRRFAGPVVVLQAPRQILLAGGLGGLLACGISPSIAMLGLWLAGSVPLALLPQTWLTWWLGDTLGVLVAAPLVLAFIGQPAADWRPRRRSLGWPLLAALALLGLAVWQTARLERSTHEATLDRELDRARASVHARLESARHALAAVHAAAQARGGLDAATLRAAAEPWLDEGLSLQALGYTVRWPRERVAELEAQARAQGLSGYRVYDRGPVPEALRGEVLALRQIEPLAGNAGALGVNTWSIPAAREAIERALASGQAAVTAPFPLSQGETGVVIYQPLLEGAAASGAAPRERLRALTFATLRADKALADAFRAGPYRVRWCLQDAAVSGAASRWAGAADCASAAGGGLRGEWHGERRLSFAGRELVLRAWTDGGPMPTRLGRAGWLVALAGLSAAAMLGALLLVVTGQTRRTELAVAAGTEALRNEVGERLHAEAALRESSERLRTILDAVPLGVLFIDPQGTLIECNPPFCALLQRTPSEVLGRNVLDWVRPEDAGVVRHLRRRLLKDEVRRDEVVARLAVGGEPLSVRLTVSALRDARGRVIRMVGVVEDITEQLRLRASEQALQRAEAASRAKSEFLSRMSHELRTPLNAMIGFAQLMGMDREHPLPQRQAEWAQQIQRAGWHLLELINETLDLARIEAGSVQLEIAPVDLPSLVAGSLAMVREPALRRQLQVEESLAPAASAALADATRLRQVLTNLLSNAVKYNRDGGLLRVRTEAMSDGRVALAVQDSGLGLSDEQQRHLFEPYNRLGRERSGIEGTGIGLVISRRLVELMGGELRVHSRPGEGSTFTVLLPSAARAATPLPRFTDTSPAPYRQRQVHYIEDNPTNVEVMRGVLLQRAQVDLSVSMLGLDGLAAVRRERPDLVLLDMHLPDISGLELLRHLKQDESVADIPVIVVSADATPAHVEQALTLGAMHYVTKPLDIAPFLALVDEALTAADTRF